MSGRSKSHGRLIGKGSIDFLIFFIILGATLDATKPNWLVFPSQTSRT